MADVLAGKVRPGATFEYRGKRYTRSGGITKGCIWGTPLWEGAGLITDSVYVRKTAFVQNVDDSTGLTARQIRET